MGTRFVGKCFCYLLVLLCGIVHANNNTVTYVYTDPQGTPLAEADANGNITATFDYMPYGSQALGSPPNGPGYTGHVNDPDTGLIYMQARYYDPATGRFLSVDPVAPAAGNVFNFARYVYGNNNPIRNTDPNGNESADLTMAGVSALQSDLNQISQPTARTAVALEASILLEPIAGEAVSSLRTVISGDSTAAQVTTQLERNVAQGKAGEASTQAKYADQISGKRVTIKTNDGTRTVTDFVTKDKGVIETKTGNAKLSKGQAKLFEDIKAGREVTPVGNNAAKAGLEPGQPTVMKSCTLDRC